MLFVTDRAPETSADGTLEYGTGRSASVGFGSAIVEIGNGKLLDDGKRAAMSVKKGQVIVYGKYGGSDVEIDGVEYKILRESDILGIIEK